MPTPKNKESDEAALSVAGWTPEFIVARERIVSKGLGARAAAAKSLLKKLPVRAAALELALHGVEASLLAGSPEVRESRVEEAKDLAKKGMMRKAYAAYDNPVGLTYGAAALAKEARDPINDPRLREQDLAYLKWRSERDFAASRKAQKAGSQQKSRSEMIRDMARPAS